MKSLPSGNFTRKIIFSAIIAAAAIFIFQVFFFNKLMRSYHLNIVRMDIEQKMISLDEMLSLGHGLSREKASILISDYARKTHTRISIHDFSGNTVAVSDNFPDALAENPKYSEDFKKAISADGIGEDISFDKYLAADSFYISKLAPQYILRIVRPVEEIESVISSYRNEIAMPGLAGLALLFIAVYFFSSSMRKRVAETLHAMRLFIEGNVSFRIKNYSDDEIGSIQRAYNRMADYCMEREKNLISEQRKLVTTLEEIGDAIAVIGYDKKILVSNRAFNSMFNRGISSTGKTFFEVIRNRSLNLKIEFAISGATRIEFDDEFSEGRYCRITIDPVSESGNVEGLLMLIKDITEKKKIDQIKTDLVSNMSHELKTPIAIMKGYLETVESTLDKPELSRQYIKKAIENADRQNSIINDILKLNMLETAVDILYEEINISDMIKGCVEILKPKSAAKDVTISFVPSAELPIVKTSRFLSEEVFFNIVDNAISYNNPGGSIDISFRKHAKGFDVKIADTGIGIPDESRERIFERFYRVDKSRSRSTGGTGLGLSIVKHAAELLGWDIKVDSGSHGTVFTVSIFF